MLHLRQYRGRRSVRLPIARAVLLLATAVCVDVAGAAQSCVNPRLFGMNIGAKNYDDDAYRAQIARFNVVILGFYRGWRSKQSAQPIREVVRDLKRRNPDILVGQYTVLNEASADMANTAERDKQEVLDAQNWWLRRADGTRVQWTGKFKAWDINITDWTTPDKDGNRYPEWLAQRDFRTFFEPVPEFDIWYFDNVMSHQRINRADWDGTGQDQQGTERRIASSFRQAQVREWKTARSLAPRLIQIGNPDNDLSFPEYSKQLGGAFLEGLMGKDWSLYATMGWHRMMAHYHSVFEHLQKPRIVAFGVFGDPNDFRLLRFSLASSLLDEGHFSYSDANAAYSSVLWFDEYDVRLGCPLSPPQVKPWKDGVYRRKFENGMVLVNPDKRRKRIDIESGYSHFKGTQAPEINHGGPASSVMLDAEDAVILVRTAR